MKRILLIAYVLIPVIINAQITTQTVKANFGVDAELRANYLYAGVQVSDDWFRRDSGLGAAVIDTTGAAARVARYGIPAEAAYRRLPFSAGMRYPQFSIVNNRLLYDAYFYRDYHGDDSTMFASGSNKNGMSPADWQTPIAQSVPDKNEILDIMMHIRRAGPNTTDSLWMFGGVSIENTTGNRYFDFELYQTDLVYNRSGLNFSGYGPDAGHTSWKFDASGNVTQVGDIIFTAEYSSSSLTLVEARIWTDSTSLSKTPVNFSWGGLFDGANTGSLYGYASITPKTTGAFYTGLQCANNTWPGAFGLINGTNSVQANYSAKQYMEFSVNLTKLGLDPVTALLGGNKCGLPFKKVLIKSRSSTSFTASLKDFIMPFEFFAAPKAKVAATMTTFCGNTSPTDIYVTNVLTTSTYVWTTTDGNIVGSTVGTSITADSIGTYYVLQQLLSSCPAYAVDSVTIKIDPICTTLGCDILGFSAVPDKGITRLSWEAVCRQPVNYFEVERSTDGVHFVPVNHIAGTSMLNQLIKFSDFDNVANLNSEYIYYRVKAVADNKANAKYSKIVRISLSTIISAQIRFTPNPVANAMLVYMNAEAATPVQLNVFSGDGKLVKTFNTVVQKGANTFTVTGFQNIPRGLYHVIIKANNESYAQKIMVNN